MKEKQIKKLKRFLKEKNLWDKFVLHTTVYQSNMYNRSFPKYLKATPKRDAIILAFQWGQYSRIEAKFWASITEEYLNLSL